MIITTTNNVENRVIKEYKNIVFGEVITGVNFFRDFGANLVNIFGGRSGGYEKELMKARKEALEEMKERAREIRANAVIGVKMDYEVLGNENNMLMVTCSGTAIVLD